MLIDTHCHINDIVKREFDVLLTPEQLQAAPRIIEQAREHDVRYIINVGTSLPESINCIMLAQHNTACYATVGIHPNDCTDTWRDDLKKLEAYLNDKDEHKIVGIGECGMDFHYPDYNQQRQADAFKAQIELALEYELPIVVHTRQAPEETLRILEEYVGQARGVIHCFSEDLAFAQQVISWNFVIGIGGTITYPKNNVLREVITTVPLSSIVLETDAPFLPIQAMRGKQNHPMYIKAIAEYIAELRGESFQMIADETTTAARTLFKLPEIF